MKSGIRLSALNIQNIALADKLTLQFTPGMNLLTGETGAGKSIIINALNLCIGGRADRDMIRTGENRAYVEALFEVVSCPDGLKEALAACGSEVEEGTLILSREIVEGRSLCRVNGRAQPLSLFKRIGSALVDIHGQHEHQFLLDACNHLEFLDRLGEEPVRNSRADVALRYEAWHQAAQQLVKMRTHEKDRRQRMDMLSFQIDEIKQAKLRLGEEEELTRQRNIISHSEKILDALVATYQRLYEDDGKRTSITDTLRNLSQRMLEASAYMPEAGLLATRLDEAFYTLEDVALEARALRDTLEYDPELVDHVESRLDRISKLKHKYGSDVEAILSHLTAIEAEYEQLSNWDESLDKLFREKQKQQKLLIQACEKLSVLRRSVAVTFEQQLIAELKELGMGRSNFSVHFSQELGSEEARFTPNGWDAIEFYLSTNPGEPLKPMARIASGGELSRIMLGLKSIGAHVEDIPCMIFDEVDTGISGHMAQVVGEKMAKLAKDRQILCVTHLPQIAAHADTHYLIDKHISQGRTLIDVQLLSEDQRVGEIARLSGGVPEDPVSLEHARNMIARARSMLVKNGV